MTSILSDLRYAVRVLLRTPGFTLAAVLSLALGIGANTAIFSVTNALLFRPLPYPDPDRLVILWNRSPGLNITEDWFSTAQYFDIRSGHSGFEEVAIAVGANFTLTGDGEPERIGTISVSANLLPMLGARPEVGRLFGPDDNLTAPSPLQNNPPDRAGTAVLSHGTWMRRYGGDRSIVGRPLTLNGQPFQVIGVLPAGFSLPREVMPTLGVVADGDLYLALPLTEKDAAIRSREDYNILGRLNPGVSIAQAQEEMDAITARLRRDHPEVYPPNGGLTFSVVPLLDQVVGRVRRPLLILLASVAGVLLIACANVANLQLARAIARRRELTVRAALGARRGRLVRQLLTESTVLGIAGGAVGLVLAIVAMRWIQLMQPADVPRLQNIGVDLRVLAFTAAISIASGILFGLAPAVALFRRGHAVTLTSAAWSGGTTVRRVLVGVELALAVVLLIGAGLLIRSFARVQQVPAGFEAANVLSFELTLTQRAYPNADAVANGYRTLIDRLSALPGVVSAGGVTALPLSNFFAWGPITVEGRVPPAGERFLNADQRAATSRYLETMRIQLVRGRWFTDQDLRGQTRVVAIDQHMARTLWPNDDPIGRRIKFGDERSPSPWETIVGIVGDVKQYALDSGSRMALYRPHTQSPARSLFMVVRTAGDPEPMASAMTHAIREFDRDVPVYRVRTMDDRVGESLARRRFSMLLLGLFAALALVLAAVGVYGVTAYLVRQGVREIGIRIALGATPAAIVGHVLRPALLATIAGLAAGLASALLLTRALGSLLFGIEPTDPPTFVAIAALLGVVAIVAGFVPAHRATRINPLTSLRSE